MKRGEQLERGAYYMNVDGKVRRVVALFESTGGFCRLKVPTVIWEAIWPRVRQCVFSGRDECAALAEAGEEDNGYMGCCDVSSMRSWVGRGKRVDETAGVFVELTFPNGLRRRAEHELREGRPFRMSDLKPQVRAALDLPIIRRISLRGLPPSQPSYMLDIDAGTKGAAPLLDGLED